MAPRRRARDHLRLLAVGDDPDDDDFEWGDEDDGDGAEGLDPKAMAAAFGDRGRSISLAPLPEDHPPARIREVDAWARERGLTSALESSIVVLARWNAYLSPDARKHGVTIRDALAGSDLMSRHLRDALARSAATHLARLARQRRLEVERQARWARRPSEPRLALLAERLRELLAASPPASGPARGAPASAVILVTNPTPPLVAGWFQFNDYQSSVQTRLALSGFEDGDQTLHCDCAARGPCEHRPELLSTLLDAIHGPDSELRRALELLVERPTWEHLLSALGQVASEAPEASEERLVWRVGSIGSGLKVEPVEQRRRANGAWTRGRKLSWGDAESRREEVTGPDAQILDAASVLGAGVASPSARVTLLRALIGHPLLFELEPPHAPVQCRRAQVTLRAVLHDGVLRLEPAIDGEPHSPEALRHRLIDGRTGLLLSADGRTIRVLDLDPTVAEVISVLAAHRAKLPPEAHDRLADVLASLGTKVEIALPEALRGAEREADATPALRLEPQSGGGLQAALRVHPLPETDHTPGEGPQEVLGVVDGARVFTRRDLREERARAAALAERLGLTVDDANPFTWALLEADDALDLLHRARAADLRIEWPEDQPAWRTTSASRRELRVKIDRVADWFGISGGLEVDGAVVPLGELLAAIRSGRRFVRIGPGQFARIEAELADQARQIDDAAFADGQRLAVGPQSVAALGALDIGEVECDQAWRGMVSRMEAARRLQPLVPAELRAELRPYQVEGFAWLARLSAWDAGCLLADDMGLGKTLQTLAVLLTRRAQGPALVVAPTSVGFNWIAEAERFAPGLRPRLYRGPDRAELLKTLQPGDLLVTSYDILALDAEALSEIDFDALVLDEAQAVKNAHTRRARAARGLSARWRVALTGTPVENHLGDLWSIFAIVSPGLLGPWGHFRDRFASPIERDRKSDRLEDLSRFLRPFVLRRAKAVVAPELPPRTEVVEPVELSTVERRLYEAARQEALAQLVSKAGDEQARIEILAALTRLRRLACHPALVERSFRGGSAKLQAVIELIEQLRASGQRALIFSQFTSFLALVRTELEKRDLEHLYLDGGTPAADRANLVGRWHEQRADLFLISLKAGGSGLNLTGADYVLHLDPWWNPAAEDQATDRTHRIGQDRPVTVVRFIAQGTIEEAVLGVHEEKRTLARGLLDGADAAAKLSSEALVDLIRFGQTSQQEAEDAAPSEPPAKSVTEPADLSIHDLEALARGLEERLAAEARAKKISAATASAYTRAFGQLVAYARQRPGQRSLETWRDDYLAEVAAGTAKGTKSLAGPLRSAVGRALPIVLEAWAEHQRRAAAAEREASRG